MFGIASSTASARIRPLAFQQHTTNDQGLCSCDGTARAEDLEGEQLVLVLTVPDDDILQLAIREELLRVAARELAALEVDSELL